MEWIKVTQYNLEQEHICCAISNNQDIQVVSKKRWLKDRMEEGLVFLKGNVRGKCFIEYIPAEFAWIPMEAQGYMYIDCLWVSGKCKGQGYADLLLEQCIEDSKAKGKKGLVVLSAKKKMSYLSDPKYMQYKGFEIADAVHPYFTLLYLPFDTNADKPHFKSCVRVSQDMPKGFVLYYTNQCPFTAKYIPLLENISKTYHAVFQSIHIQTKEEAQNAPTPFTTFSLFYDGQFVTHEILSEKKFEKILMDLGL